MCLDTVISLYINGSGFKIIVHAPDKSTGHRRQRIEMVWNFIGEQDEGNQTAKGFVVIYFPFTRSGIYTIIRNQSVEL